MAEAGRFITFEGGEGVGKSTQIKHLSEHLNKQGVSHIVTREPGGSPGAEAIRSLVVTGDPDRWNVVSETLLLYAAREDLLESVIRPALQKGDWVLCDRFADSSFAYQGAARGMPLEQLAQLNAMVVGQTQPDLTVVMHMDPAGAIARTKSRAGNEDRFERFPIEWHETLANAFLDIAAENPGRCFLVEASAPAERIADEIFAEVKARFLQN